MSKIYKHLFQQYGFNGTGTGYMAILMHINFKEVTILNACKHEGPTDLYRGESYDNKKHIISLKVNELHFTDFKHSKSGSGITQREIEFLHEQWEAGKINYIIINKNPYSWMRSYIRKIKLNPPPYSRKVPTIEIMASRWNQHNDQYRIFFEHNKDKTIVVRYEDLLLDLSKSLERIHQKFNLEMKYDEYRDVVEHSADIYDDKENKKKFDIQYYLNREYMNEFTKDDICKINATLLDRVMKFYGYEKFLI